MKTITHKGYIWNFEHFFINNGQRFMRISVGKGRTYFAANVRVEA